MRWDGESEAVAATLKAESPSAVGGLSSTCRCRRTSNSSVQLTLVAVWRHTLEAGSGPFSAVAGR
jgi:hypothetical protein